MTRRVITLFAIACALVLRAAVPSGWMPAANAQGAFALMPCPAAAPAAMAHGGHDGDHGKHDQKGKAASDCAFAPIHAGFDLWNVSQDFLPPPVGPTPSAAPVAAGFMPTGPPSPPPPATGPPISTLT